MAQQILMQQIYIAVDTFSRYDLPIQVQPNIQPLLNALPRLEAHCVWCLESDIRASGRWLQHPSKEWRKKTTNIHECSRCGKKVDTVYYY